MLKDTKATKIALLVLVVILGLSFSLFRGCDITSRGSKADQSVAFTSSDSLKVSTITNNIIIKIDPNSTQARVSIGKSDNDTLSVTKSSSQLSVEVKPKKRLFFNIFSYKPSNLVITLPTSELNNLDVSSVSGSIQLLQPITAQQIRINSTSGKVDVLDVQAKKDIRLSTISGSIRSNTAKSSGNLEVLSTSGSLKVEKVSAARSILRTVSGSIDSIVFLPQQGSLEAKSTSGSVKLDLRNASDLSLNASTVSGRITFNGQEQEKKPSLSLGASNQSVNLSSVSGSIAVTH
jgi:DUF4097 and DUF4098 domain-containing protein YvlB